MKGALLLALLLASAASAPLYGVGSVYSRPSGVLKVDDDGVASWCLKREPDAFTAEARFFLTDASLSTAWVGSTDSHDFSVVSFVRLSLPDCSVVTSFNATLGPLSSARAMVFDGVNIVALVQTGENGRTQNMSLVAINRSTGATKLMRNVPSMPSYFGLDSNPPLLYQGNKMLLSLATAGVFRVRHGVLCRVDMEDGEFQGFDLP